MAMNVKVNGVLVGYPAGSTVSDIVARLAVMSRRVEVRHNGQAVPLHEFARTLLSENDAVDVKFGGQPVPPRARAA